MFSPSIVQFERQPQPFFKDRLLSDGHLAGLHINVILRSTLLALASWLRSASFEASIIAMLKRKIEGRNTVAYLYMMLAN
jgi:hypothetical protein